MFQGFYWLFQLISSTYCASFSEARIAITELSCPIVAVEEINKTVDFEYLEEIKAQSLVAYAEEPTLSLPPVSVPEKERSCGFLIQKNRYNLWGSFIYWKARQDYMDVALTAPNVSQNGCCGFSFGCGRVLELDGGFHPGFRGGASFGFHNTDWKVLADYTYFHNTISKSKRAPEHGFLFVKWIQPNLISNNASSRMHTEWDLKINALNSHIGKIFFFGSKLSILPYWGIATVWIDQEFTNRLDLLFPETRLKVKNESSAFLIGPRMGASANYEFLPRFGLAANLAGEIFYGHYDISLKQKSPTDATVFASSSNTFSRNNPEVEMYAGLYYRQCLSKRIYLKAEIGYDFQVWWNQNLLRWYNDITYVATPIGNLYFQGLRISLNLGF